MSDFPKLIITSAGLSSLVSAQNQGIQAKITHMAVGAASYEPTGNESSLLDEQERRAINDYSDIGSVTYLACIYDGDDALTIREIGLFLEDGTLFGLASHPTEIIGFKAAGRSNVHLQRVAIQTSVLPAESLSVELADFKIDLLFEGAIASVGAALARMSIEQLRQADEILKIKKLQEIINE